MAPVIVAAVASLSGSARQTVKVVHHFCPKSIVKSKIEGHVRNKYGDANCWKVDRLLRQFPGLRRTEGAESESEGGSEGNRKRHEPDESSASRLPTAGTLYLIFLLPPFAYS